MTTGALSGQGTILKRSKAAFPNADDFEAIAEIRNINGPEFVRDMLEVTHTQSNFYKEYIPGNKDLGDISMDVNFVPGDPTLAVVPDSSTPGAVESGALKDFEEGTLRYYRVVYPDVNRTFVQFSAFVRQFSLTASQNDPLSANLVLKGTGAASWGEEL